MQTIGDASVLAALIDRLEALTATRPGVWGTMSAHQMVLHLADGAEATLGRRSEGLASRGIPAHRPRLPSVRVVAPPTPPCYW